MADLNKWEQNVLREDIDMGDIRRPPRLFPLKGIKSQRINL